MYRTPLRPAPIVHPGAVGTPYLTEFGGEYRIDADGSDVSVRIYRDEMDVVQMACLANPRGRGSRARRGPRLGLILALISIPIVIALFTEPWNNGLRRPRVSSVMRPSATFLPVPLLFLACVAANPASAQSVPRTDSAMSRAISGPPQNTRGSSRRQQVFSEAYSASASGPYYVNLDSGVTYRVFIDASGTSVDPSGRNSEGTSIGLTITPRVSSLPPIRFSATMFAGNNGAAFEAPATTGYRVETFYNGREAIIVRILREAVDVYSAGCVADPTAAGCRAATDVSTRPKSGVSPAVLIMIGFLPLLFAGMMRNGKSF